MPTQLTADDFRQSLTAHVAAKGDEIHAKYGPRIDWPQLLQILQDRTCVRYPCEIIFDEKPLQAGEFAYPLAKGQRPEEGFTLYVHPYFSTQRARVPSLALYQLVAVNYGEFASSEDAEVFGASALGIAREEYYRMICEAADEVGGCSANPCG